MFVLFLFLAEQCYFWAYYSWVLKQKSVSFKKNILVIYSIFMLISPDVLLPGSDTDPFHEADPDPQH